MPRNSKQSSEKPGDLASDQKERSYYYDDAHGYEPYDPDADDDDTDCETKKPGHQRRPGKHDQEKT
jgi:hypothetical protein